MRQAERETSSVPIYHLSARVVVDSPLGRLENYSDEIHMRARASKANDSEMVGGDFVFTWKEGRRPDDIHWPYSELRKVVETFRAKGTARLLWRCAAHRKIQPGDRVYMLKQGKPIGIFGRGTVVGKAERQKDSPRGANPWRVPIRFDASREDVLWDPRDQFLVVEKDLLRLDVPRKQWQLQGSGKRLDTKAARKIDSMILNGILVGRGETTRADEMAQEAARHHKLIDQWTRPDQQRFRERILSLYRNKCAVTGCVTQAVLEAAHIKIQKGQDDNNLQNGILLRADIHALFDRLLVTLSADGTQLEISPELTDSHYAFLKGAPVDRPNGGRSPSGENIGHHRKRFFDLQRRSHDKS